MYLMKHIDKKRIYALYDEALGAAETALFRNNIRLMRMAFRYSDLETQQEGAEEQYPYQALKEYSNVSEELLYMTEFAGTSVNNYCVMKRPARYFSYDNSTEFDINKNSDCLTK